MMKNSRKLLVIVILTMIMLQMGGCSTTNSLQAFVDQLPIPQEVTENLELKSTYDYKGKVVNVTWTSSNEKAISLTGVVTRTTIKQQVILIAKATLDDSQIKKTFIVNVKEDISPIVLDKAASSLIIDPNITHSIILPSMKQIDGETVYYEWESSHEDIIDKTGNLTLPMIETNVTLKVTISVNGLSTTREFIMNVPRDPNYSNGEVFARATLFADKITNEKGVEPLKEFTGAIYHKVCSSRDFWLGIEVIVTLPTFIGDEKRTGVNPWGSENDIRYLDNASVYLGGNCEKECDVGLTWSFGANHAKTGVDYSKSVAFRPFWRYISTDNSNTYQNSNWQDSQYYYYPGDKIRMSVYVSSNNKMQLRIELLEETTIPEYAAFRAAYNLGDNYSKLFVSPEFNAPGAGIYPMVLKRVCALDQVNNEGKPTSPTNASSNNVIYHECYLYRKINGVYYKVAFNEGRQTSISSPSGTNSLGDFTGTFHLSYDGVNKDLGGEVVSIIPNNGKK